MPAPPEGEAELRALAERFRAAERRLLEHVARGSAAALAEALLLVVSLRRNTDARTPIVAAYFAAGGGGVGAVEDLALSLGSKLDRGAQTASDSVRRAFGRPDTDPLAMIVANVDRGGRKWGLGAHATMVAGTLGRVATSRGVADAAGPGARVRIEATGCSFCSEYDGEYEIQEVPAWPPFHPSCTCVAAVAR